jgi:hypothetical protein
VAAFGASDPVSTETKHYRTAEDPPNRPLPAWFSVRQRPNRSPTRLKMA